MAELLIVMTVALVGATACVLVANNLGVICGPNEVTVISKKAAGNRQERRVIHEGWHLKVPLVERVDRLDTTIQQREMELEGVATADGDSAAIVLDAWVRIGWMRPLIDRAIDRFAGKTRTEVGRVADESIQELVREVISELTIEELRRDRLVFTTTVMEHVSEGLANEGLRLENLLVQKVEDTVEVGADDDGESSVLTYDNQ